MKFIKNLSKSVHQFDHKGKLYDIRYDEIAEHFVQNMIDEVLVFK